MTVFKVGFNVLNEFIYNRTAVIKMNPYNFIHKYPRARNIRG